MVFFESTISEKIATHTSYCRKCFKHDLLTIFCVAKTVQAWHSPLPANSHELKQTPETETGRSIVLSLDLKRKPPNFGPFTHSQSLSARRLKNAHGRGLCGQNRTTNSPNPKSA